MKTVYKNLLDIVYNEKKNVLKFKCINYTLVTLKYLC